MTLGMGHVASSDDPDAPCGTDRDAQAAALLRVDFTEPRLQARGSGQNRS